MNSVDRFNYLDSLKGIAIIAVILTHVGGGNLPGILGKIGNDGARGVQMFFIISGMLAFSSLDHMFSERREMDFKSVGTWYLKKYFRLFPLFYIAMLISMLTGSWSVRWLGNEGYVTIKNIIAHIFFVHGLFPHYTDSILGIDWYLGVLAVFYFITPLLYKFINSLEKSLVLLLIVQIASPFLNGKWAGFLPVDSDPGIYNPFISEFGPLAQIYVYCMGIVLFFVVKKMNDVDYDGRDRKLLAYTLLVFGMVMMYGQITTGNKLYKLSYTSVFGIWLAIIMLSQSVHSCRLIDNQFFCVCGKYSYGMYLFQFVWIRFYDEYIHLDFGHAWTFRFVLSVLGLFLISYVFTRLIDNPIQRALQIILKKIRK